MPLVDAMILQGADQLQSGAVADVREARVAVPAEVALQDAAVGRAVEHRAPGLQLAHARRRFLGVELGHPPVVDVLPAAHRVGEVDLPVVAFVHVGQGGGNPPFRHDRVGFAQERLAHEADRDPGGGRLDCGPQPGPAGADDQDIMLVRLVLCHAQRILQSVQTPIEQRRTYRSLNATQNRLHQAQTMCPRFRQLTQS